VDATTGSMAEIWRLTGHGASHQKNIKIKKNDLHPF
jgi:hypothetical protein